MKVIGVSDSSLEDGVLDGEFADVEAVIESVEVVAIAEAPVAKPAAPYHQPHRPHHKKPDHRTSCNKSNNLRFKNSKNQ